MNTKPEQNRDFKVALDNLRNELYDELPTGEVEAFDLILLIKKHIKKLDKLIEDVPDEGQPPNSEQKTEMELLRDRYASMAANPPMSAYAHNDRATIEDYEGMMKDLEQQLREAGAMS